MKGHIFLVSENCILKPIEEKNLSSFITNLFKWVNDPIVTYFMFTGQKPMTKSQVKQKILDDISGNNIVFMIRDRKTDAEIGTCGLYDLHDTARKGEFRILIGNRQYWNKGYGTEIAELVTFYGFDRLNLNRIYLGYTSENKAAGKAYEKAGYKYEGTLREDIYRNSKYYDSVKMSILRSDYYNNYKSHLQRFSKLNEDI